MAAMEKQFDWRSLALACRWDHRHGLGTSSGGPNGVQDLGYGPPGKGQRGTLGQHVGLRTVTRTQLRNRLLVTVVVHRPHGLTMAKIAAIGQIGAVKWDLGLKWGLTLLLPAIAEVRYSPFYTYTA